jgi:hypothetical protein
MPQAVFVLDPNLIAEQHFRAAAFPAPVPCAREHETTRRVEVDGRDDAAAVAGDDGERHGAVAGRVGLCHVVDP